MEPATNTAAVRPHYSPAPRVRIGVIFSSAPADNCSMRNGTAWILGIIVAVVAFHMYTRRVDTGDLKKGADVNLATATPAARGGAGIALETSTNTSGSAN